LIGSKNFYLDLKEILQTPFEFDGLGKEQPRIDGKDRQWKSCPACLVHDHDSGALEAGADRGRRPELIPRPLKELDWLGVLESSRELPELARGKSGK
jgi:hypothetical protein